jgi:protein TonB
MMGFLSSIDGKPLEAGNELRSLIASSGSAAFHGAVILSLLAASYAHVEPLEEARDNVPLVWIIRVQPVAAAPPAAPRGPAKPEVEEARQPSADPAEISDIVQPQEIPDELAAVENNGGGGQGIEGGSDGGIDGGIPGGIPGGVAGGIPGGVPGGVPDGVSDGFPDADQPLYLTGEVRPPERTTFVMPEYPEVARKARAEGKVILEIVVGRMGDVEDVKVLRSNPLFDQAAVEAVKAWKYRSALQSGRPVKVYLTVVVDFELT